MDDDLQSSTRVSRLDILSTEHDYDAEKLAELLKRKAERSLPEYFEAAARRFPSHLAIKTQHRELTYDALCRAANRVARAVVDANGLNGGVTAVMVSDNVKQMIATLGVLKAGRAFTLLDRSHPAERTSYVLDDCHVAQIVVDEESLPFASRLTARGRRVLSVDEVDSGVRDDNLGISISPDDLASIAYTSGSTGRPRGVEWDHRNQVYRNISSNYRIRLHENDRMLNAVSSGSENLRVVLTGACAFPWDVKEKGFEGLSAWMIEQGVTVMHSVPTVFRHFAASLTGNEGFPNLRLISLRGEPVYKNDVELYKRYFSDRAVLVNQLGITETGTFCHYVIDQDTRIEGNLVPVGYPVAGKEVQILDEAGNAIGYDEVGEIAVISAFMSLGYRDMPDLTRTRFFLHPDSSGRRTYITGDMGLMRPDGCIVHMGRKDFQVKIRGNRIETAEIEALLLSHNAIAEVAVVALDTPSGEKRLVAYVVPSTRATPTVTELRGRLSSVLPDHMIPSAFVALDVLPQTQTGKLDRRALPDPPSTRPALDNPYTAPRTPLEARVASIWSDVLGLDDVGIHDNFMELGGHSLLATRVISRVISEFRTKLPLQSLFDAPTVAEMAVVIVANWVREADEADIEHMLAEIEAISG